MEISLLKLIATFFGFSGASVLIAALPLYTYRALKSHLDKRKSSRLESLSSLKEFVESKIQKNDILIREHVFENHFGKPLTNDEIIFFLNTRSPTKFIQMYLSAKNYVEVPNGRATLNVREDKNLTSAKRWNLFGYIVFGVAGFAMLLSANDAFLNFGPKIYAPWSIVTLCFFVMAWVGLDASTNADTAKELLRQLEEESPKSVNT